MLIFTIEGAQFPDYHIRYAVKEEFDQTKQFPDVDMTDILREHGIPEKLIGDMEKPNIYTLSRFDIDIHEFVEAIEQYDCYEYDPYLEFIDNNEIDTGEFKITIIE